MPVGQAFDKDLRKFFGVVFAKFNEKVNLADVANVNLSVGGGVAQFYLPGTIDLTERDVAAISNCVADVSCLEGELLEFALTKAMNNSKIVPKCETGNISPEVANSALENYLEDWNRKMFNIVRGVENVALDFTASATGDDIRADIKAMLAQATKESRINRSEFIIKLSPTAYDLATKPDAATQILGFSEESLRRDFRSGMIWEDIDATADVVIYPKPFNLFGASCLKAPQFHDATGSPQYEGNSYIHGKAKYGGHQVTMGADADQYREFLKIPDYSAVGTAP